jgi:hypothetical protein
METATNSTFPNISSRAMTSSWGVLSGLFLKPLVASEVLAESDFDEDEVALLAVESARV